MDDGQALLAAIAANPDEDTPRVVYADWLTENGQPERGEFIRFQCRAARADAGSTERAELEREAATIFAAHREQWEEAFTALGASRIIWGRGFPVDFTITASTFIKNGSRICDLARTMTSVVITDAAGVIAALAHCPHLAQVTVLYLSDNEIGNVGARALADSPHLARLTHLDLSSNHLGVPGARALADSPHLARLTHLNLRDNYIGLEDAQPLAESPHFRPDMYIGITGFDGVFRDFQQWVGFRPRIDPATSTGAALTSLPGRWRRQVEPKNQPPGTDDTPDSERPRR